MKMVFSTKTILYFISFYQVFLVFWDKHFFIKSRIGKKKKTLFRNRVFKGNCKTESWSTFDWFSWLSTSLNNPKLIVSYQSVEFSKSPDSSPKLGNTIPWFFLGIGRGQLRLKLVSPNCQKTDSEICRCRSLIPFSENLENCRLTISNTIIFSKFLVGPGGENGVAHCNLLFIAMS